MADIQNVLNILASKGYITQEVIPKILEEEDFQKKCGRKKKTSEERRGVYDEMKCDARVWCEGYDNVQCSFKKIDGSCFCTKHKKCVDREGGWWLGKITEKRPENPEFKGIKHQWKTDENGNEYKPEEIEVKTEEKKRTRGRPKGSKNKKKKEPKTKEKKELTIEEIEALLKQKKNEIKKDVLEENKEENIEDQEENVDDLETNYIVDGVTYELNNDDILDPEDFSIIGKKDGNGGIIFEDEDVKNKHQEYIDKLST